MIIFNPGQLIEDLSVQAFFERQAIICFNDVFLKKDVGRLFQIFSIPSAISLQSKNPYANWFCRGKIVSEHW